MPRSARPKFLPKTFIGACSPGHGLHGSLLWRSNMLYIGHLLEQAVSLLTFLGRSSVITVKCEALCGKVWSNMAAARTKRFENLLLRESLEFLFLLRFDGVFFAGTVVHDRFSTPCSNFSLRRSINERDLGSHAAIFSKLQTHFSRNRLRRQPFFFRDSPRAHRVHQLWLRPPKHEHYIILAFDTCKGV